MYYAASLPPLNRIYNKAVVQKMQATALIFYIAFRGEQTAGSHALAHRTFTSAHSCGSAVTFRSERKYHYIRLSRTAHIMVARSLLVSPALVFPIDYCKYEIMLFSRSIFKMYVAAVN